MNKKNKNIIVNNILNLVHLESNIKKQKNISFPFGQLKSSISSYAIFLNKNKKQKNSNKIKNNNKKNAISYNNSKKINSIKSTEILLSNIVNNNPKNKNIINNINNNINQKYFNNNFNQINQLEQNAIDYFINPQKIIHKQRNSHSVQEQRKKIINDLYSKKHNKEKEINCLKLSSNNTNSTSINTNNTNNFNSKNNKRKNTLSMNIEEIKKENKNLKTKIEIIGKENKILNVKINKLRDKNLELGNILYSLKKEKDDYSQSINQSLKLLKLLKKNGLELSEIMDNLSNSNSENEEENEDNLEKSRNQNSDNENYEVKSDNKKVNFDYFSENDKNEDEDSNFTDVSFGRLESHEEFSLKKIPKGLKNIPKLKIYNIQNDDFQ